MLHKPTDMASFLLKQEGKYNKTEGNLRENGRVELLIASKQVQASHALGQGCRISGKGELQTTGEFAEAAKEKFPWSRQATFPKGNKYELYPATKSLS